MARAVDRGTREMKAVRPAQSASARTAAMNLSTCPTAWKTPAAI